MWEVGSLGQGLGNLKGFNQLLNIDTGSSNQGQPGGDGSNSTGNAVQNLQETINNNPQLKEIHDSLKQLYEGTDGEDEGEEEYE